MRHVYCQLNNPEFTSRARITRQKIKNVLFLLNVSGVYSSIKWSNLNTFEWCIGKSEAAGCREKNS